MSDLKKSLQQGTLVVGTMVSEVRNPNIAYLLAQCGFDFFIIDNEHGTFSYETISNIIAAARGAGISVIVRVPEIRREAIMKPLDSGADGLLVPMVDTPEQAAQIMSFAKYPPAGNRGVGLRRAHSRYAKVPAESYMQEANERTLIIVQAETRKAIENVESIARVKGVDGIFVGPMDLSVQLGIPGRISDPREVAAIDRVIEVCRENQLIAGIQLFDLTALKGWVAKGIRFATYSGDVALLADAAVGAVAELREVTKTD